MIIYIRKAGVAMTERYDIAETTEFDALPLEYHRDYGTARGYIEVSAFVNNPFINSPSSIYGLLSAKEIGNLLVIETRVRSDDAPNLKTTDLDYKQFIYVY